MTGETARTCALPRIGDTVLTGEHGRKATGDNARAGMRGAVATGAEDVAHTPKGRGTPGESARAEAADAAVAAISGPAATTPAPKCTRGDCAENCTGTCEDGDD